MTRAALEYHWSAACQRTPPNFKIALHLVRRMRLPFIAIRDPSSGKLQPRSRKNESSNLDCCSRDTCAIPLLERGRDMHMTTIEFPPVANFKLLLMACINFRGIPTIHCTRGSSTIRIYCPLVFFFSAPSCLLPPASRLLTSYF